MAASFSLFSQFFFSSLFLLSRLVGWCYCCCCVNKCYWYCGCVIGLYSRSLLFSVSSNSRFFVCFFLLPFIVLLVFFFNYFRRWKTKTNWLPNGWWYFFSLFNWFFAFYNKLIYSFIICDSLDFKLIFFFYKYFVIYLKIRIVFLHFQLFFSL